MVPCNPHQGPEWRSQAGDAGDVADGGDGGSVGINFLLKKNFKMGSSATKDYRNIPPLVPSQAGARTQISDAGTPSSACCPFSHAEELEHEPVAQG